MKQNFAVSGINGIENHDSELVKVTINTEECGSQRLPPMVTHKKLVIGDSYYNVQRMKRQYPQLQVFLQKDIRLRDVKVIHGTECYSISRPLQYQRRKQGDSWPVRSALGWTVSGRLPKGVVPILSSCLSSILQMR